MADNKLWPDAIEMDRREGDTWLGIGLTLLSVLLSVVALGIVLIGFSAGGVFG